MAMRAVRHGADPPFGHRDFKDIPSDLADFGQTEVQEGDDIPISIKDILAGQKGSVFLRPKEVGRAGPPGDDRAVVGNRG